LDLKNNNIEDINSLEPLKCLKYLKCIKLDGCQISKKKTYPKCIFDFLLSLRYVDEDEKENENQQLSGENVSNTLEDVADSFEVIAENVICEICNQQRGKRGYKIHLNACRKRALSTQDS
jgi:hypothetical protein